MRLPTLCTIIHFFAAARTFRINIAIVFLFFSPRARISTACTILCFAAAPSLGNPRGRKAKQYVGEGVREKKGKKASHRYNTPKSTTVRRSKRGMRVAIRIYIYYILYKSSKIYAHNIYIYRRARVLGFCKDKRTHARARTYDDNYLAADRAERKRENAYLQ